MWFDQQSNHTDCIFICCCECDHMSSSILLAAVIKLLDQKQLKGWKVTFQLLGFSSALRESRQGSWKINHGGTLFACLLCMMPHILIGLWLLSFLSLWTTFLVMMPPTYSWVDIPNNNQENASKTVTVTHAILIHAFPRGWLFFQTTLGCVT